MKLYKPITWTPIHSNKRIKILWECVIHKYTTYSKFIAKKKPIVWISKFHLQIHYNYQYLIFSWKMSTLLYSSPTLTSSKNNGTRRQRKRLKRHRFFALCPVFPSKGVRKPRKRTMAQSKNRLVLAIKRHALSIHERKTWSTRCTWSRETFVQARLERFEHNVFSPAFADITQGNLARTCGKYIPLLSYTRKSVYYIQPFLPLFISSISSGIRRGKSYLATFTELLHVVATCRSRRIFRNQW